jgi:hypothetical protein
MAWKQKGQIICGKERNAWFGKRFFYLLLLSYECALTTPANTSTNRCRRSGLKQKPPAFETDRKAYYDDPYLKFANE